MKFPARSKPSKKSTDDRRGHGIESDVGGHDIGESLTVKTPDPPPGSESPEAPNRALKLFADIYGNL